MAKRRLTKKRLQEFREYCQERVRYWQAILGMQDWRISVDVRREPWNGAEAWADFELFMREGVVGVFADSFFNETGLDRKRLDLAIIHELLHMCLGVGAQGEIFELYLEIAMNTLARAFLELNEKAQASN